MEYGAYSSYSWVENPRREIERLCARQEHMRDMMLMWEAQDGNAENHAMHYTYSFTLLSTVLRCLASSPHSCLLK